MMYWLKFVKNVPKWSICGMTSRPKPASVGAITLIESRESGGLAMQHSLRLGTLMAVVALTLGACGRGAGGEGEDQQAEGRPLPKYEQASLPPGRYHTTEFQPSLSFRITGDRWVFEGPSGALGDPERSDYLFIGKDPSGAQIAFFNLRKVKGIYKPMGRGERQSRCPLLMSWSTGSSTTRT